MLRIVLFAATLIVAGAPRAEAQPDFSESTIVIDRTPVSEGEVAGYDVRLRNSGTADAPYAEVQVDLPLEGMFVDLDGLPEATVHVFDKVVTATLPLAAGGERRFRFRMVVPRDAGGLLLSPTLRVRYLHLGVEHYAGEPTEIATTIRSRGVAVGPVRVHPAAFAVAGVLALYPLLRLIAGRRASGAPAVAIVIAIGFWLLFAGMAVDDWRTVNAFTETRCTVLDSRLRAETEPSRLPRTRGLPRSTTTDYQPLLALRYVANGVETISTGYDTDSRLSIGGADRAQAEAARWRIGAEVPCWFDPEDPGRVVVIPGFGGAYLFALFPLPLFAYGVWALSTRRR